TEELTLMRQITKARFAALTGPVARRRLACGIVILFLLMHQAWAGIVCQCHHEESAQQASQMAHSCCQASRHSGSVMGTDCGCEAAHSSPSCGEEGGAGIENQHAGDQFGALAQGVTACCHSAPQTDAQEITIPLQDHMPVINTRLLIDFEATASFATTHLNFHQLCCTRPLYLSFSCFLI